MPIDLLRSQRRASRYKAASPTRPIAAMMDQFEQDFPFAETEDQLLAIDAIKEDMISGKAMDRLICGDVGYGKTEVAMRAAFKAVCDGKKQVAVLVPTTVLAMQHYETFSQRMADFPIQHRHRLPFPHAQRNKETLEKVQNGEIDILIGTHRILTEDVALQRSRPPHHRRRAALRRPRQRAPQKTQSQASTASPSPPRRSRARSICRSSAPEIFR